MATLSDLNIVIGATIDDFEAKMGTVQSGLGRLSDIAKSAGASLSASITLPLGLLAGAAVVAFGKIDSLTRGLNAISTTDVAAQGVTGLQAIADAASQTKERLALLQEIAKAPGIGFEQAVQGDIRLRAVGISAGQSAAILKEFANAIALTGGGAAQLDSVTVQLGQMAAKGKVLAQDLRPIIEAAPAVAAALKNLYGTVDSETISKSLEKQGKSSTDFINQLTDVLAKTPRVTGGLANTLENLQQAGTQSLAKLGAALNQSFNLDANLGKLADYITELADKFAALDPGTQKLIFGFVGITAAVGPVLFAIGTIGAVIGPLTVGFGLLGGAATIAWTAITGPIGLVVAGLVLVGAAAFAIREKFGSFTQAAQALGAYLLQLTVGPLETLRAALALLGFPLLSTVIGAAADKVQLLAIRLGLLSETAQKSKGIFEFFGTLPQEAPDYFSAADVAAKKHILTLKELQEQLAAALQNRFNDAQAGRSTTADDADIARIRALIAEFKQLPGHASAAEKALAKLRAELKSLTALDSILAAPADGVQVVERRIKTLETGLKNLLDAGVSPSSKAFRAFADEALNLNQGLAKLQASSQLDFKVTAQVKLPETLGEKISGLLGTELANHPILVPLQLAPLKLDFAQDIANASLAIGTAFSQNNASALAFGKGFNRLAADADTLQQALAKLISAGINPLDPAFKRLAADYAEAQKASKAYAEAQRVDAEASQAVQQALVSAVSGIAEALGSALAGAANVGDSLIKSLLNTVGTVATRLGELAIGIGLGVQGIRLALSSLNPVAALAAGVALLALGSFAKSAASSIGASPTGSGGSGGSTPTVSAPRSTFTPTVAPLAAANGTPSIYTHKVEFTLSGSQLTGALAIEADRIGRVTGRRG